MLSSSSASVLIPLSIMPALCSALTCSPCDYTKCKPPTCPGGIVPGLCCCYRCTSQVNESCGGGWDMFGECDKGLECTEDPGSSWGYDIDRSDNVGICKTNGKLRFSYVFFFGKVTNCNMQERCWSHFSYSPHAFL